MQFHKLFVHLASLGLVWLIAAPAEAQLASRPVEEWIKTLDGPQRVADHCRQWRSGDHLREPGIEAP